MAHSTVLNITTRNLLIPFILFHQTPVKIYETSSASGHLWGMTSALNLLRPLFVHACACPKVLDDIIYTGSPLGRTLCVNWIHPLNCLHFIVCTCAYKHTLADTHTHTHCAAGWFYWMCALREFPHSSPVQSVCHWASYSLTPPTHLSLGTSSLVPSRHLCVSLFPCFWLSCFPLWLTLSFPCLHVSSLSII